MRERRALLGWAMPAALILAVSVGLTIRQASSAHAPERVRFSGSSVVQRMPSLLAAARLPAPLRVAVVHDRAAAEYYGATASLDTIVQAWADALRGIGADVLVLSSDDLARAGRARVLVIPSSPCLTLATRAALARAGEREQGIVITVAPGTHDAGCRRIGYGLLVAATAATRAEPLRDRPMVNVTVPDGSPLSMDVPPGARIDIRPGRQIALRGVARDAYYATYDLRPEPADGKPLLDAALTRGSYQNARVVYWGFELRDVVDRPWNRAIATLLVRNSVAWAAGMPLVSIEPWPGRHRAAAILAQDVEYQFGNARHAVDSLQAIGIRGTHFIATAAAGYHGRLTRRMASNGEVGSHTVDHTLLGGLALEEQRTHLHASQADLLSVTGHAARGLRPPEEQFDRATMAAWLDVGGSYLLGVNDWRSAAPELLTMEADTLVLVPRTGIDDIAVLARSALNGAEIEKLFREDLAHLKAIGGLYTLSYHSQLLARPEHVPLLARIARTIAADSTIWAATAAEVAEWWTNRAQLRVSTTVHDSALALTVWNPGAAPVSGVVARVTLPPERRVSNAGAELLTSAPGVARVYIPDLPPGMARRVTLTLAPVAPSIAARH